MDTSSAVNVIDQISDSPSTSAYAASPQLRPRPTAVVRPVAGASRPGCAPERCQLLSSVTIGAVRLSCWGLAGCIAVQLVAVRRRLKPAS